MYKKRAIESPYIGQSLKEVEKQLKKNNETYRIIRRDKERFMHTMEVHLGRLNLEVDDGIVTSIKVE